MIFAAPAWLWALVALPLVAALELRCRARDRERTALLVARPLWARVVRRPAPRLRWVRLGLLLAGTAGLVLALARPQWGIVREKVEREGVDVVLALDTSGSMATEDVSPNRFFLARAALLSLMTRLDGDRFGLLAFEGEAYPLVPLTLDADAVGLFLETVEPGIVPAPGSSLGVGLSKGLEMFVDRERRHKVLVLVSDGEDLEGEIDEAVRKAKESGIVVHTVGVGSERGEPVPDFDRDGNRVGFKKDEQGAAVVSRLNAATLEAMARATGGRFFRLTPADASLGGLAAAIEGMEQRTLAREFSYRRKERFQWPLGLAVAAFGLALSLGPLPRRRAAASGASAAGEDAPGETPARRGRTGGGRAAAVLALLLSPGAAAAEGPKVVDEVLLRPRRLTEEGRRLYQSGNHPGALEAFESAAGLRPKDPQARFNLADALYKNGRFDEAEAVYRSLAGDVRSPLAAASRFNLGNALYQKQDYEGAVAAYRDALRLVPDDADARRNLELALRALQKQKEQQQQQKQQQKQQEQQQQRKGDKEKDQDRKQGDSKEKQGNGQEPRPSPSPSPGQQPSPKPKTEEEKEQERFRQEAGMPRERAMQLLDALQRNEKDEQKRLLAAKAKRRTGKDW
jgi:Ca-activated chloride channel family protein